MTALALPYADWSAESDWDTWAGYCDISQHEQGCFVGNASSIAPTISKTPLTISGNVTVPVFLDQVIFASKRVAYTWGYRSCKRLGDDPTQTIVSSPSESFPYSDTVPDCPEFKTISYNGTLTLNSTLTLVLEVVTPWVGNNTNNSNAIFGGFNLKVTPLDPSAGSTTISAVSTAPPTAPISSSNSSSITSSNSTTSTRSLSSLPPIDVTSTSQASSVASSVSTMPVLPTGNGGDPQSSRTTVIAGAVVGAFAVVVLVILAWWRLRRQTRAHMEMEETGETVGTGPEGDSLAPSMTQPHHNYRGVFQSSRKQRDEIPSEPSETEETSEGPMVVPQTPRPPQESLIPRDNGVPLPAYENYMDAPLVTFRPSGTRRPQGIEDPAREAETVDSEDVIRKWAEGRRDLVPVHLERRLRSGGYNPTIHPDEISEEIWMERFGVTRYELAGLRDAYGR